MASSLAPSPSGTGTTPAVRSLSHLQYLAYVAPIMATMFLWGAVGVLQGIYAKYFGVSLTTIAMVLLISRVFDAVTDPLIGYWSDRCQASFGTRKPFVIMGCLLSIVSSYFLYVPVDPSTIDSETVVSTPYFLGWFLLFYLAWTLVDIPHMAWASELAPNSRAKNKIYNLRFLASLVGMLCFYLVPFLPFFDTREYTPQTLQWTASAGLLVLPMLYLCVRFTPNGPLVYGYQPKKMSFWEFRSELSANPPFLIFITAIFLLTTGMGMWFGLIFIVVDNYLGLGQHFASISLVGLMASILALGVWYRLVNLLGKKFSLALSAFLCAATTISTGFLAPGQVYIDRLSLVMFLAYISAVPAIAPSMLAEIVDYSTWKFGIDRTATYFSFYGFIIKTSQAIGGSLALGIIGWYGFNPSATLHTEDAIFGLHVAMSWMPTFLILLSFFAIGLIPISEHRHHIIRRRLDSRVQE